MLKIGVLVSGGGTNLQAIMDAIDAGEITNAKVDIVISNNASAYALERARKHDVEAMCIAPKDYPDREAFHKALLSKLQERGVDLIVLAGYLVAIPPMMVEAYPNKIINIHPSLIPSFCGTGYYGLHVHEAALAKGVKVTGATVHFVNAITDGGPIIAQKAEAVRERSAEFRPHAKSLFPPHNALLSAKPQCPFAAYPDPAAVPLRAKSQRNPYFRLNAG